MSKDNLKITQNQHRNRISFTINKRSSGRARYEVSEQKPHLFTEYLAKHKRYNDGEGDAAYKVINLILLYARNKRKFYPSLETLMKETGIKNTSSMSRALGRVELAGYLMRINRKGTSVLYILNKGFNRVDVQNSIRHLFPWMQTLAFILLLSTFPISGLKEDCFPQPRLVALYDDDANTRELGSYFINIFRKVDSCEVEKAKQSKGVPRTKRSVIEAVSEIPYWSHGERQAAEINAAYGPPIPPHNYATANSLKRSAEYEFVPQPIPIKATSDSFDNNPPAFIGDIEMPDEAEPTLVVPHFEEGGEWEEVYVDAPVGNVDIVSTVEEQPSCDPPAITIRLEDKLMPIPKGEKVEAFVSPPMKSWNAPMGRKVNTQEDVETLGEFIERQLQYYAKKREKDEQKSKWTQSAP